MSMFYRQISRLLSERRFRYCFHPRINSFRALSQTVTEESLSADNENVQKYLEGLRQEFYNLKTMGAGLQPSDLRRIRQLSEVVSAFEQRMCVLQNMSSLKDMENEKDPDMKELIKEEKEVSSGGCRLLEMTLCSSLYSRCIETYSLI